MHYKNIVFKLKKKQIRTKKMRAVKKNRLRTLCFYGVNAKLMATKALTYKTLQVKI